MERPSSQLENVRPSGLRMPSKLPSLQSGKPLHETTSSDLNTRTAGPTSMLPPPSTIPGAVKHKIPGLPEPAEKVPRKTLSQRAGEPANAPKSTLSHKSSVNGFGTRPLSKYGTYHPPRNVSTANSIGGLRPPSRQANSNQLAVAQLPSAASKRNVEDDRESDTEGGPLDRRKGTTILSFRTTPVNGIPLRKTRTQPNLRHPQVRGQPSGSSSSDTSNDGRLSDQSSRASSASSFMSTTAPAHQASLPGGPVGASQPSRNVSLVTAFAQLMISPTRRGSRSRHRPSLERISEENSPSKIPKYSCTPALKHTQSTSALQTPSPLKHNSSIVSLRTPLSSASRGDIQMPRFLTKEKLSPVTAWDTHGRIDDIERMYHDLQKQLQSTADSKSHIDEALATYKSRVQELQNENRELVTQNRTSASDLERARSELHTTTTDLRQVRRDQERELHDLTRRHERELEETQMRHEKEMRKLEREREKAADHFERKLEDEKKTWQKRADDETANLTTQHWDEMEETRTDFEKQLSTLQKEKEALKITVESRATESAADVQLFRDQIAGLESHLETNNATVASLRTRIATFEAKITALEQEKLSLISKTHFLEGNQEAQSQEFTNMREEMEEAIAAKERADERSRKEEALRRKLNATILELRGNIRVFVRTRPLLDGEENPAKVEYFGEDSLEGCKEMVVYGPPTQSATGKQRVDKQDYAFDRIFTNSTKNTDVFEECRELIQSVIDGYNVSILSYGQTGSGKTFGMTGPEGIIPSSIHMLLSEMKRLREKGWEYVVEASFVEVYNETLNDLLADAKTWDDGDDLGSSVRGKKKEKHEIHHDAATGKTSVSNMTSVSLWPPPEDDGNWPPAAPVDRNSGPMYNEPSYTERAVNTLLDTAGKNRRVAATKANERSSRSHSVFILTLRGSCAATNQSSEGVLNLVDLAGSEKLKQSGAEGNRLKETAAINKSLSALGDVIVALGNKNNSSEAHVPYRNSKLTYLLQSSLGGTTAGKSSRTLMLLHLSPLQAHWSESKSSLLFGSKANGAHVGTAKKK